MGLLLLLLLFLLLLLLLLLLLFCCCCCHMLRHFGSAAGQSCNLSRAGWHTQKSWRIHAARVTDTVPCWLAVANTEAQFEAYPRGRVMEHGRWLVGSGEQP